MKLFAPSYYPSFQCIADQCTHSCCVGWEIDIDPKTHKLYQSLTAGYGKEIKESMEGEDPPHFRLGAGDRCPHLNERGLCKIILNYGDSYLCEICREHPRFYHRTSKGLEVGLGMACEEACRLILSSDGYAEFVESEEIEATTDPTLPSFDALSHRSALYALLSKESIPYSQRLETIASHYGISIRALRDEEWQEQLASLEYLDESHRELFALYSSSATVPIELEKPMERALAYWIYRHVSDAYDEEELCAALGFCLFCERLLASMAAGTGAIDLPALLPLARILSEELEYSEENTDALKLLFLPTGD